MSTKHENPQEGLMLHSSAAAFELRHEAGGRSREEREAAEGHPNEMAANDVTGGFTRRCGRRAPTDGRPCMHMFGHDGPHAWELEDPLKPSGAMAPA